MILYVYMTRMVLYLVSGKLRRLFMEGDEEDLVLFLQLLLYSEILASVK